MGLSGWSLRRGRWGGEGRRALAAVLQPIRDVFVRQRGGVACAVAVVTGVAVCDGSGGGEEAGVQGAAAKHT